MNPAFLDAMSWEMAEVYGAITDQILINLSRYFRYYQPGDKIPRTAFEYQAGMLAQMGKVNADTIRIIRNGLQDAPEALKNTLEQAIIDSVSKTQPELLKGVKAGILAPQGVPIVDPEQMRAFKLYYEQSADRLNLVNTVMLESTQSAYQQTVSDVISDIALSDRMAATYQALDIAAGETVTGVSAWNTALRHATDKLKNRGITGFVDHAGRQWSAEAYVAMDIRTTTFNVGRAAVWEQNQDFGNDLYLVSYHNGARPGCYDWQNKVISSLDVSREVVDLDGNKIHVYAQSETTYGQPAGLFGINCKHYPNPFIPHVSVIHGQPQSPEENEKTYQESQEQRRLERKLRESKRDYLMAKAQGAPPEELSALRDISRNNSQKIDDFCESTGRARHRDREAVYTKREFPNRKKYDASAFKKDQQKAINEYFTNGGAQQRFSAGQLVPNEPITPNTPPAPVAPLQNVAQQATQAQQIVDTTESARLYANNLPDAFNKKRNKAFADAVNATEGADPDVVELFNKLGEQVNGANYPIGISYPEDNFAVDSWVDFSGNVVKVKVKVPKLDNAEFIQEQLGTTAHEWGHLFDRLNGGRDHFSYTFNNGELPNALKNARPMSERVRSLIDNAVKNGKNASELVWNAKNSELDLINNQISEMLRNKDYAGYTALNKKRNALWKEAAISADRASRNAHGGIDAVEDIFDAISGGTLRDKTNGLYGHGSKYYRHNPGGENAATETLANYCNLALAYPDLFHMMAEEQPEIWQACGNIVKAMIGR